MKNNQKKEYRGEKVKVKARKSQALCKGPLSMDTFNFNFNFNYIFNLKSGNLSSQILWRQSYGTDQQHRRHRPTEDHGRVPPVPGDVQNMQGRAVSDGVWQVLEPIAAQRQHAQLLQITCERTRRQNVTAVSGSRPGDW